MVRYFLFGMVLLAAQRSPAADGPSFSVDASVVTAVENGPLVVKATLTYRGEKPIYINGKEPGLHYSSVTGPASWKFLPTFHFGVSPSHPREIKLASNDSIIEYLPAHRHFPDFAGSATIMVHWNLEGRDPDGPRPHFSFKGAREVRVVVAKQTPTSLSDLCGRLCRSLDQSSDLQDAAKTAWRTWKVVPGRSLLL